MVWPGLFLAWLDCSNSRNSASENQDTKKYCIFQGEIPSLYAGRDKRGKTMSVTTLIKTCVLPLLAVLTTCSASVFAHPDPFHRIEQLSVRIRETPDSASLYLKRASLYLAVGRSAEAVSDLRTVRVLAPENDRALLLLGRAHLESGDHLSATTDLDASLTTHPRDTIGLTLRARAHAARGD